KTTPHSSAKTTMGAQKPPAQPIKPAVQPAASKKTDLPAEKKTAAASATSTPATPKATNHPVGKTTTAPTQSPTPHAKPTVVPNPSTGQNASAGITKENAQDHP